MYSKRSSKLNCQICGAPIAFSNSIRSKSGRSIPLEVDGVTPHTCPTKEEQLIEKLQRRVAGMGFRFYKVKVVAEKI